MTPFIDNLHMKKFSFCYIISVFTPSDYFYQPWVTALSPTPRHVSPEQLEKTVRYLTQTVHPRNAGNIDNLNRSAEYIKEFFVSSGARVTVQGVPDWLLRLCAWKPELPLPGNVLALSRSGRLYCCGRQNAGYQRRSSGKSGIVVIPGFICLFYECPRVYSRY